MPKTGAPRRVAVIGLGRFGESAARTLADLGYEVTAIDIDERRVAAIADRVTLAAQGDGTNEEMLCSLAVDQSDVGIVGQDNNWRRADRMKLHYDAETDSLYIDLNARPSVNSAEIADGVVLDVDADGRPVGFDIQHASEALDLSTLETEALPVSRLKVS